MRPASQKKELLTRINQLIQNKKYYLKEHGTEKTAKKIQNEIFQYEQVKILVEWHEEPKQYLTKQLEKLNSKYELISSDTEFNNYKQTYYSQVRDKTQSAAFSMFLKHIGAPEIKFQIDRLKLILQV